VVLFIGAPTSAIFKTEGRLDGSLAVMLLLGNVILLALTMILSRVLPPAPDTNRRLLIMNSRYQTPAAAAPVLAPAPH